MNNLPHSVKVDRNIEDDYYKNYDAYNMSSMAQVEDYVCVLENVGQVLPELVLGLNYRAATSKQKRKDVCENKYRGKGTESTIYIRKDDLIDDKEDLQCGVFKSKDDSREIYKITGEARKFPSKKLCDKYKNKGEYDIYTKMIRKDHTKTVFDTRTIEEQEDKIKGSKLRIIWATFIIISIFLLYWTINYSTKKPYDFFDFVSKNFINKGLIIILFFGIALYIWCPFDTCYHRKETSILRKNLPLATKRDFCHYLNDNICDLENLVCNNYDNSSTLKKFTTFINGLFNLNRIIERPLKGLYGSMCVSCNLEYECIDRSPKYSLKILSPYVINEIENSLRLEIDKTNLSFSMSKTDYLNAVNKKYKTKSDGKPYDTGNLIILKTNNDQDINNNLIFMSSVVMLPNGYEYKWIVPQKRTSKMIDKSLTNEVVDMKYDGKRENLKLKVCTLSNRILSIDNNYELLGYNYPLTVDNFISFFENNGFTYRRFFFYPNFDLKMLKSNPTFNEKAPFMKRKFISIYKYLINHPNKKFICPNVSIVNGEYIKYEITDLNDTSFINSSDKFIEELKDFDDYYNDDEDDKEYLDYHSYYENILKLNYKERMEYRSGAIKDKLLKYTNDRKGNSIISKIDSNSLKEKIIRSHDLVPFKFEKDGILYKCTICKQSCFVKN